jgi:hypothetical protein
MQTAWTRFENRVANQTWAAVMEELLVSSKANGCVLDGGRKAAEAPALERGGMQSGNVRNDKLVSTPAEPWVHKRRLVEDVEPAGADSVHCCM